MIELALSAFVTLFVVIDPIGSTPIFAALTGHLGPAERARAAKRAVALAGLVLVFFALAGDFLLSHLSISLEAFRIAGGLLLFLLSIDMVMVRQSGLRTPTPTEAEEGSHKLDPTVFPLAIPLVAGPGAMTSIVLLARESPGFQARGLVLFVLVVVLGLTSACFLGSERLLRLLGITGVNVATRVFGILTAALAVQFVLDGLRVFADRGAG